jgi:acetyl esterase/lipase
MQGAATHAGSRKRLLGDTPGADQLRLYSNDLQAHNGMPPTFLLHAADDPSVPVENALLLFSALRQARVDAALHVFHSGGHGFGLTSTSGPTVGAWPDLFLAWAGSQRMLS